MLFNSWIFWVFFAVVLPIYWLLPYKKQNLFLIGASYLFYGWWDWRFLILIAFSTVMDYYLGKLVAHTPQGPKRRYYVSISVIVNLALLGVFKYYNFFSAELAHGLTTLGIKASLPILHVILPVGISFYTFQSMSYVLDISRGKTQPATNFLNFCLYVCFFPHLVAGPIMRSGTKGHDPLGRGLLKQIETPRFYRDRDFQLGLYYIVLGLFKKIVIGDNMASLVNTIFQSNPSQLSGLEVLAGVYAFAWQIYADFSGYSSIAQGAAKWMGIDLMDNFKMPYLAVSPSDFWARWHISLSTWLRDYVYISMGGNRQGKWMTQRNLLLTMIIGGIWHGANWTFIAWGVFHGLLLCGYRLTPGETRKGAAPELSLFGRFWRVFLMFNFVCLGWLLFRAESMSQALSFIRLIVTHPQPTPVAISMFGQIAFYAGPLLLYEIWVERRKDLLALASSPWWPRALVYAYCAVMLLFFPSPVAHAFIYFQF
ncbi:MAG: MBOAT family O-acyltransferase [Elusimicrobiota bacterium]|jgi:D-alanyl-lipoteichoic acid acyltransferase DltB (MBOAT superfamily)